MAELQHDYNFNDPLELTKVFRVRSGDPFKASPDSSTFDEPPKEYASKVVINWEDIKMIEEYPYPDDWNQYKGEKYYLTLHNLPHELLILGNFNSIYKQYKVFRNQFPLFTIDDNEDYY